MVSRKWSRRWFAKFPRIVPLTIFLLVAAITIASVFGIERGVMQRERAELESKAQTIAAALERRASANSANLRAGSAMFSSLDTVSESVFRRFVEQLRIDSGYRGADGIGWAPRLRPAGAANSRTGDLAEEFDPVITQTTFSTPVTFLLPDSERNRRAVGFDMYSEPVRRDAMDAAARSSRPTASGRLTLKQENGTGKPGFIVYMPVFRNTDSGRVVKGFIYSPFNAQIFLDSALEGEQLGKYGLLLYDGELEEEDLLASAVQTSLSGSSIVEEVIIANRQFLLEVRSAETNMLSPLSMATLFFGMLVAALLLGIARMVTRQALEDAAALAWFEEQASIRNSLTRELNHRVKNTLANVLSIVSLTRRRAKNLDDFADGLDGRIRSLSATHDLLTQSEWGTTPVASVVRAELAPYFHNSELTIRLDGPEVELAPSDALSLGLALHELATNAAKFGALSQPGGQVSVTWKLISEDLARIKWSESGGPTVSADRKRGFGTELIEKIVAHELKNPVDLRFNTEGVICSLILPVRIPREFAIRAERRIKPD
ncbi:CHASE domain-containing protein [Altererythrobacter aquiaggeris]|uniref:CHASE domain-containing protein n=1 Tax=Aestuarierythrobacter aquiaggeris TaxID=1898396 RepID=UPI00301A9B43